MLHKAQSRFRSNHCTQDVLLKTVEDWRSSLERNEIVGSVFVDLSKAFDSINHCLLRQKLALYIIYTLTCIATCMYINYNTLHQTRNIQC